MGSILYLQVREVPMVRIVQSFTTPIDIGTQLLTVEMLLE